MVLEFINQGGQTKAEFKATANFNLHIEGVPQGGVRVYQSSAEGGKYALIQESVITPSAGNVYDFDFIGEIFPKFIKVVCANQPTYAEVVSSGEVTEIKSQSVEIEITSNGIQEVMADAGFAYMDRVTIKTNVPQSGEGGGSAFKYHKLNWDSPLSGNMGAFLLYGGQFIVNNVISENSRVTINAGVALLTNALSGAAAMESVKAVITCPFPLEVDGEFKTYTIEQFFAQMGAEGSAMLEELLIPITEEEYYNEETYA